MASQNVNVLEEEVIKSILNKVCLLAMNGENFQRLCRLVVKKLQLAMISSEKHTI